LQSHRCGQIQSGNVFHFVAACYLATEFLYFWVSAHFQKHFIRLGDGQSLFNQAVLNQNAMIRRYCQRRWMGLRNALVLFWVFHCTMLTRFLNAVIPLALVWSKIVSNGIDNNQRLCNIAVRRETDGTGTQECNFLEWAKGHLVSTCEEVYSL
jgi:hypothetical protein